MGDQPGGQGDADRALAAAVGGARGGIQAQAGGYDVTTRPSGQITADR
jgi:hypothetical protein